LEITPYVLIHVLHFTHSLFGCVLCNCLSVLPSVCMSWCICMCVCLYVRPCVSLSQCVYVCLCLVGSPLEVSRAVSPTEDQIDQVHQQYIDHLVSLFESHKSNYGISQEQHLNIV